MFSSSYDVTTWRAVMRSANGDGIPISQLRELGETDRPFPDNLASINVPDRYFPWMANSSDCVCVFSLD